ncbi:unnamed protein product [Paramecium pentaurelia]|uniref:Rab-GAP TBC domain-containing protein n=1 Tax=Paramecium pentaurelia TaxID=43138 RepID=A0A8S1W093_9CILI|nr:unnamed protein product [Paramecium pentaurelia]
MIQHNFNPFRKSNRQTYSLFDEKSSYEIKVEDEQAILKPIPKYVWEDDYYEQLKLELKYYKVDIQVLSHSEWEHLFLTGMYDSNKNLLLSIFTTRSLTVRQVFDFITMQCQMTRQFEHLKKPLKEKNYESIIKDVHRTFKSSDYFQKEEALQRLQDILVAYCNLDSEVSYGQGMNFIVAALMYLDFNNDEAIFEILRTVVMDKEWRLLYINGSPGLFFLRAKFNFKFQKRMPELYQHFLSVGIEDMNLCVSAFYLTLFMQHAPIQFSLVLLAMYFIEGHDILTKMILSMMKYFENYLLKLNDFQQIIEFIKRGLINNFYREIQQCRKQQRLVQVLLDIGLIKRKDKQHNQKTKKGQMKQLIDKQLGNDVYSYFFR